MSDNDEKKDKKLHVDADWKAEARAEKERLAQEQAAGEGKPSAPAGAGTAPGAAAGGGPRGQRRMRPASFETLLHSLAAQAMVFLGGEVDPETGRPLQNLDLAKHSIDLLGVLEEKTKGNLTNEEKELLDALLYQTRMAYVQAAR